MKFTCDKSLLQSCVNTVSHTVSPKSSIPALEGILLETVNGSVRLSGYDLKTGIITTLPADIISEGDIVLNAKLFVDIIRRLPNEDVTIDVADDLMTHITCGLSHYEIMGIQASDFPEIANGDYDRTIKIRSDRLRLMLSQTSFAISMDDTRPVHTGSLFETEENVLTVVSVDGFRLAVRKEQLEEGSDQSKFVVPGNALNEVEKILDDTDDVIGIHIGAKHIMFTINETTVITRRLEGEFLNYKTAVPKSRKYTFKIDRKKFLSCVERVSLIISEQLRTPVRCKFGDGIVRFNTMTTLGKASDECEIEGDGEDTEIGFNNRYLLDALKAAPSDEIYFMMNTSVNPCVITPADGEIDYTYMILPVRLSK